VTVAAYRVIAADLLTGARIAELPIAGLTFGSSLNDVGECSGRLPFPALDSPGAVETARTWNAAVDEVRRRLVVERDGTVVWSGIVWASPYNDDGQTREVRAAETWSYYRRRFVNVGRTFRQVDQLDIARTLLEDSAAIPAGDLGVTFPAATSGVLRDRTYAAWERKRLGEAVEELAAVIDGFDFAIDARWDTAGDRLVEVMRWGYPRLGRATAGDLVLEVGRNVVAWTWPTDGTRYANVVQATGAGDGPSTLRRTALEAWQVVPLADGGPGYPFIEENLPERDVLVGATLQAKANAAVKAHARPVVVPSVTVRADRPPVFGTYGIGDACRFRVPPGLSPRFPDGLDVTRRVIGWTVTVDDNGAETVDLMLGEDPGA
jgi:hypothetical protein